VKDSIVTKHLRTTCGSKMLHNFVPPYSATAVDRVLTEGAVILGKTNCDEFCMGTTTESSFNGPTHNPWDLERVPGGSSGGSAAAIAADEAPIAFGTDTGGSIRCPAAFCGTVGLKPTYGRVSRYGLIAYASSLDQIGTLTKDVEDSALLLSSVAGKDGMDATSVDRPSEDYTSHLAGGVEGDTFAVPGEFIAEGTHEEAAKATWRVAEAFEELGAERKEVSMPSLEYSLATYYILAMCEASSNLARYDGVRYGYSIPSKADWIKAFSDTRGKGFGPEVRRRIILGTYALSAGYYNAYYMKALQIRTLIKRDFEKVSAGHRHGPHEPGGRSGDLVPSRVRRWPPGRRSDGRGVFRGGPAPQGCTGPGREAGPPATAPGGVTIFRREIEA
jgi:aspartyl-tRNA(Asn)/glutamyl-tRNA(Gln) amidotransferase subunit A